MEIFFTVLLIALVLYPLYWIYDNWTSESDTLGQKISAFVIACIIFIVGFFLMFPSLLID
jgi:hypothetical protein